MFVYDENGMVQQDIMVQHPYGLFVDDICPHHIGWTDDTPRAWMRDNVRGHVIRWHGGLYFSDWTDAMAFKLRWK